MKLSSTQYFILAALALAILTALTILKLSTPDILVGILVGILYAAAHVSGGDTGAANLAQGVQIGVPLQAPDAAPALQQGEPG